MKQLYMLTLFIFMTSCGGVETVDVGSEEAPLPEESQMEQPLAEDSASTEDGITMKIKLKSPDKSREFSFKLYDSGKIKLQSGGLELTGNRKDSGKRKYTANGSVVAEVKPKDPGFKVRNPAGELLWKIKVTDQKIKVSDNEENLNPYEISRKESDRSKVKKDGAELGQVKYYADTGKLKLKDASGQEVLSGKLNGHLAAFGVLLLERIPEQERLIIAAELWLRDI